MSKSSIAYFKFSLYIYYTITVFWCGKCVDF
jgi:hypothetical protein